MNRPPAPTKIALGQVFLLLGVLSCSKTLGFIPDQDEQIIASRAALCEAVAMNCAALVGRDDMQRLKFTLARVVKRSPALLSAGVRRRDGSLVTQVADHRNGWSGHNDSRPRDAQVQAPIWIGQERWGRVEFCFEPLSFTGKHAWLLNPWTLHTVFVLAGCYVAFTLYLGRKLDGSAATDAVSRSTPTAGASRPAGSPHPFDLSVALTQPPAAQDQLTIECHEAVTETESRPSVARPAYESRDPRSISASLPSGNNQVFCSFVESLGAKILELHAAWQRRDLDDVYQLAHWIKESGSTVGVDDFAHPATILQQAAQQGDPAAVEAVIEEIISLYQRINMSSIDALREDALA